MLEICKFFSHWATPHLIGADQLAEIFTAVTGLERSGDDLLQAAERAYTVERAFIVREGAGRADDCPPEREFSDPLPPGPWPRMPGGVIDRGKYHVLLTAYYRAHGWEEKDGIPTRSKLEELRLPDVADSLEQALGRRL
jgi:aldehyde:ferredoxin oxidoreductase